MTGNGVLAKSIKRVIAIHPERKLPRFPQDGFTAWAKKRGLMNKPNERPQGGLFAGCSARYYFPEVAKATVEVLQHNDVAVYLPEQKCCGMPTLQEGDREFTSSWRVSTLRTRVLRRRPRRRLLMPDLRLPAEIDAAREGAQYSADYRALVEQMACAAKGDMEKVSTRLPRTTPFTGRVNSRSAHGRQPWMLGMVPWKVFSDQGYFAEIGGLDRLRVANHTYDLGEYLRSLQSPANSSLSSPPPPARLRTSRPAISGSRESDNLDGAPAPAAANPS